jgi:hypothetical protein
MDTTAIAIIAMPAYFRVSGGTPGMFTGRVSKKLIVRSGVLIIGRKLPVIRQAAPEPVIIFFKIVSSFKKQNPG